MYFVCPSSMPVMNREDKRHEIDICITARDWQSSDGDFQTALARALERSARSRWRVVCPNILVECIEPYRTLVLGSATVQSLRAEEQSFAEKRGEGARTHTPNDSFQVTGELHSPLSSSKINGS